jgi:hypothetical protein
VTVTINDTFHLKTQGSDCHSLKIPWSRLGAQHMPEEFLAMKVKSSVAKCSVANAAVVGRGLDYLFKSRLSLLTQQHCSNAAD